MGGAKIISNVYYDLLRLPGVGSSAPMLANGNSSLRVFQDERETYKHQVYTEI